jgi:hypothetical protein
MAHVVEWEKSQAGNSVRALMQVNFVWAEPCFSLRCREAVYETRVSLNLSPATALGFVLFTFSPNVGEIE